MNVQFAQGGQLSARVERCHDGMLRALGSTQLEGLLFDAIREVTDLDRIHCFDLRGDGIAPTLLCAWSESPCPVGLSDRYRMACHYDDPIRGVLPTMPPFSCAAITFCAEEVRHEDYRLTCFDRRSVRHRLSVVKRVGDVWHTLSLARRSHAFTTAEISELAMIGRLALPLIAQHHRLKSKTPGGNFSVGEMERRLEAIEKGFTPRERQVCARTIVGISAEGAALDLGISVASVLTYRQRGYRRVNVSNAMQLATLVMH